MSQLAERIMHYDTKCQQHLNRVRLSHLLALRAVSGGQFQSDHEIQGLIRDSFADEIQGEYEAKMRTVLHKLHLISLKANFELFLNRLLSTVWALRFAELSPTISGRPDISLRDLAAALVDTGGPSFDVREFVIDRIVPVHGLQQFKTALEQATHIDLPHVLNRKNIRYWPQIYAAFEVRHLVEHRDGWVDREFVAKLGSMWVQSSWGRRDRLDRLKTVPVEEEDVVETYTAMFEARGLLTTEVLRWGGQTDRPRHQNTSRESN